MKVSLSVSVYGLNRRHYIYQEHDNKGEKAAPESAPPYLSLLYIHFPFSFVFLSLRFLFLPPIILSLLLHRYVSLFRSFSHFVSPFLWIWISSFLHSFMSASSLFTLQCPRLPTQTLLIYLFLCLVAR